MLYRGRQLNILYFAHFCSLWTLIFLVQIINININIHPCHTHPCPSELPLIKKCQHALPIFGVYVDMYVALCWQKIWVLKKIRLFKVLNKHVFTQNIPKANTIIFTMYHLINPLIFKNCVYFLISKFIHNARRYYSSNCDLIYSLYIFKLQTIYKGQLRLSMICAEK